LFCGVQPKSAENIGCWVGIYIEPWEVIDAFFVLSLLGRYVLSSCEQFAVLCSVFCSQQMGSTLQPGTIGWLRSMILIGAMVWQTS
jgi:hypothetical protein